MTPVRYRFALRTLADPPEFAELEAGPFTPYEASMFGQMESAKRVMKTGRAWVCNYSEIADGATLAVGSTTATRLGLILIAVLLALIVGAVGHHALQRRADETCRARSRDTSNVTLCRGEVYAVNVLGAIECGCQGTP